MTLLWPSLFGAGSWALLAATAMTYAVCEEIARYLSFRAGRSMRANWAFVACASESVTAVSPADLTGCLAP
ncbi:hypothetical protein [Saccharopolyspora hattusasensis]|uniref:hypothetical protein n=1 Tax=Saccharopolyspora hattusasensis TaxID=1128679 RepID=UPI003D98C817